jgi:hypothetical protein
MMSASLASAFSHKKARSPLCTDLHLLLYLVSSETRKRHSLFSSFTMPVLLSPDSSALPDTPPRGNRVTSKRGREGSLAALGLDDGCDTQTSQRGLHPLMKLFSSNWKLDAYLALLRSRLFNQLLMFTGNNENPEGIVRAPARHPSDPMMPQLI